MEAEPPSASKSSNEERGPVRNVVLVHGAYTDGSSWIDVIEYSQRAGLTATAVQNPLVSLADDVAHTSLRPRPSRWSDDACWSLTPVPSGEGHAALAKKFPTPAANAGVVFHDRFGALTEEAFLNDFANGIDHAGQDLRDRLWPPLDDQPPTADLAADIGRGRRRRTRRHSG